MMKAIVFASLLLGLCSQVTAAPQLVRQGSKIAGVSGLEVRGAAYDVVFVDGRCVDLFEPCTKVTDFTFRDRAAAAEASQALIDFFSSERLAQRPDLILGCGDTETVCEVATPWGFDDVNTPAGSVPWVTTAYAIFSSNLAPAVADFVRRDPVNEDLSLILHLTYASWTMRQDADTDPLSPVPTVWRGKPIPEQVPGATEQFPRGIGKINVALWFNQTVDRATLAIGDRHGEISSPRIHCGLAGEEGPRVWQESGTFEQTAQGQRWLFRRGDLLNNDALERCGVEISTIASLRAAAQQRRIYLEYEREGQRHRAQLWQKELLPLTVESFASPEQVIGAQHPDRPRTRALVKLRATETKSILNKISYLFADSYLSPSQLERAALYCAPAGQAGVRVADLPAPSSSFRSLRARDLIPTDPQGPCGVRINTIASLVEAWLQGRLYVLVTKTDGSLLRGQIAHP